MGILGAQERGRKVRAGRYLVVGEFERRIESPSIGRGVHGRAGGCLLIVSLAGKG